jgi:hypothetical protein
MLRDYTKLVQLQGGCGGDASSWSDLHVPLGRSGVTQVGVLPIWVQTAVAVPLAILQKWLQALLHDDTAAAMPLSGSASRALLCGNLRMT